VSLLAAPDLPLGSRTVIEPPAFGVARGDPAVEAFLAHFEAGAPIDPRAYLEFFLPLVGSSLRPSDPLPPALEAGARAAIAERSPHEAVIPLDALAATDYPKLVVSGGHSAAFDAVCDVLEDRLGAQRAVLPGAGHSIPRAPGVNETLASFVTSRGQTPYTNIHSIRLKSPQTAQTPALGVSHPTQRRYRKGAGSDPGTQAVLRSRAASSRRRTRGFRSLTISSR
jgi:hypothetical protein